MAGRISVADIAGARAAGGWRIAVATNGHQQQFIPMPQELPTQESAPIDVRELLERCMGNIDLAERVLSKLESQFQADITELERAYSEKNDKRIASVAHRLKGSAANIAAHDLQKCAAEIEDLARQEIIEDLPAHFDKLRAQWLRIKDSTASPRAALELASRS
jgi:HPt (histidine-containing phosphotransfer) domain-containing protein